MIALRRLSFLRPGRIDANNAFKFLKALNTCKKWELVVGWNATNEILTS